MEEKKKKKEKKLEGRATKQKFKIFFYIKLKNLHSASWKTFSVCVVCEFW